MDFILGTGRPLTMLIISPSSHMVLASAAAVHPWSPHLSHYTSTPTPGSDPLYLPARWEQQSF